MIFIIFIAVGAFLALRKPSKIRIVLDSVSDFQNARDHLRS